MDIHDETLKKLLTVKQVASRLNCAEKTVYNLISCGLLPKISLSSVTGCNRAIRVPEKVLSSFIDSKMKDFLVKEGFCAYCKTRQDED